MYVSWIFYLLNVLKRGHRDRMVVGFTTTCAISAYHHKRCEFKSQSWQGVHDTTLCDKVCQWLAGGRWFSVGTLVFSTKKTDHHDITEILLKVALNTITLILTRLHYFFCHALIQCIKQHLYGIKSLLGISNPLQT